MPLLRAPGLWPPSPAAVPGCWPPRRRQAVAALAACEAALQLASCAVLLRPGPVRHLTTPHPHPHPLWQVYGAKTFSNNNHWLRRKLFEAIGVDPAKGAVKKAAAGGGRRRRGAAVPRAPRAPARTAKPRAAAARGGWGGYSPADEWELYPGTAGYAFGQQYGEYALPAGEYAAPAEMEDDEEDHSHVAEALLALGEAAATAEDGFRCEGAHACTHSMPACLNGWGGRWQAVHAPCACRASRCPSPAHPWQARAC